MRLGKVLSKALASVALLTLVASSSFACTDVMVGRKASVDGSVMTSHTADSFYDANIRVIPGKTFKKGAMTGAHWNILGDEGKEPVKIGEIPQVEKTYSYFHVGYPFMNEYGVTMGESTIAQKEELKTFRPDAKAILTIEQLEIFGLQRAKTAREAIKVMGSLAERYGFIGSCCQEGECLTVTDSKEAWVFEIFSTGFAWTPESGKPGAIWVAKRVPDDEVFFVANMSRIREVDPEDKDNYMVSKAWKSMAIDMGWYNPDSGEPFIWQEAYSPRSGGWSLTSMGTRRRLYILHKLVAPSGDWNGNDEIASYPFSVKPEKKLSAHDVMSMLRSYMKGTAYDMSDDPVWKVEKDGKLVKSPLATPFPNKELRTLLGIAPYYRPVAKWNCSYSFVSQARENLPKGINTVLWFGFDNPYDTCYVPVYCGITGTRESWRNFDRQAYGPDSARCAFMIGDELVNKRFQEAAPLMKAVRDPLEKKFFSQQAGVEKKALELYKKSPAKAMEYLTNYTSSCMEEAEKAWWKLDWSLITKFNNMNQS